MSKDAAGVSAPADIRIEPGPKVVAAQKANILASLKLLESGAVKAFEPMVLPRNKPRPPLHVVAGGSSVVVTVDDIDGDICAINGAHDWLIIRGIIPRYALFLDWADIVYKGVTPRDDVIYLCGSQCHPLAFEVLKGKDVRVWHTGAQREMLPVGSRVYGGGPNATQRVIPVLYEYGYREFHFHGVDACFYGGDTHVYDHVSTGTAAEKTISVNYAGRDFLTNPGWLCQAQQFEKFLGIYAEWQSKGVLERIDIKVHGDGLIPQIARMHGCHVHSLNN